MNADRYIAYILADAIPSLIGFFEYDDSMLMYDNARTHAARTIIQYLDAVRIAARD